MTLLKILLSIAITGSIFFTSTAHAYDLPKTYQTKASTKLTPVAVSDWSSLENFLQKMKEAENLPAGSPARINNDKNLIFIGFYNDRAYFLDRYSLEVEKNSGKVKSWRQHIYPLGKEISPANSKFTQQKFSLQNDTCYNSLRKRDKISDAPTAEDKKFLAECFKVGYYYAFKRELDAAKFFDKISK